MSLCVGACVCVHVRLCTCVCGSVLDSDCSLRLIYKGIVTNVMCTSAKQRWRMETLGYTGLEVDPFEVHLQSVQGKKAEQRLNLVDENWLQRLNNLYSLARRSENRRC